jgi:Protoglobin
MWGALNVVFRLVQMNALLGFLSNVLFEVIASLPLDAATSMKTLRAFNKLLWIQNDFVTRHYQNLPVTKKHAARIGSESQPA